MKPSFWVYQRTDLDSILGGNQEAIRGILREAERCWKNAREQQISVYTSKMSRGWSLMATRPKRPLQSVILNTGVKEAILEDALNFLDSKGWYLERGIPFRRGYLLVSRIYICACARTPSRNRYRSLIVCSGVS